MTHKRLDEIAAIPRELMERMEREADVYASNGDGLVDPAKFYAFLAGAQALWSALIESDVEFDYIGAVNASALWDAERRGGYELFKDGARWQFDQNKAQLTAMRAERDRLREELSTIREAGNIYIEELRADRANLRAALELAKNILNGVESPNNWLDEIEKLERGGV